MTTLRSRLSSLANSFADEVLAAIRATSVQELIGSNDGPRHASSSRGGNARGARGGAPAIAPGSTARRLPSGRLARRSDEEIDAALARIVTLLGKNKEGLRAEQIRTNLGMQSKEMPRILREGVAKKKLTSKGQKRATTYFAK